MTPDRANRYVWLVWAISWFGAAVWSNRTIKHAGMGREMLYRGLALAGAFLLFGSFRRSPLDFVFWGLDAAAAWTTVVIAALGLTFTWWARIHLGRLWSGQVTRKEDHHIVATGPYALVRHPIYCGVVLAAFATAALRGSPAGLLGALFITAGLYVKARLEEQFLREELGAEGYDACVRRVPMFMPRPRRWSSG